MQQLTRRTILAGAAASVLGSHYSKADGGCPTADFYQPFGVPICNSFVNPKGLQVSAQSNSEWCWAATTSNLFAYYNRSVSQAAIVQAGIGAMVNQPATFQVIESVLNRQWTDSAGHTFTSAARILYSVDAQQSQPSNADLITSLQQNHPLLYCNMSHAMMLVSVNYLPPVNRPQNLAASIVVDPWPGMGLRALTQPEQVPAHMMGGQLRLLMQVQVI